MKISACWIVKNEAANIGRSIESLAGAVDELIVVDTGSTDDTVEIAKSYGARVEHFDWIGDFSAARNYALSFAMGDLFFFLDADEYFETDLTSRERNRFEEIFSNRTIEVLSFKLINIDKPTGRTINANPAARLFRNTKTNRYRGKIHEYIKPAHSKSSALFEGVDILHTGYSEAIINSKLSRNYEILVEQINAEGLPVHDRVLYSLYAMREAYLTGKQEEAAEYLSRLLKHPKILGDISTTFGTSILYNLYKAIETAAVNRGKISRRDVEKTLFGVFKKVFPSYPGTAEIDLLYQMYFDTKEDRFLRELEPAIKRAADMGSAMVTEYKSYEKMLYATAAFAAKRRGDPLHAMEYAVAAFADNANRTRAELLSVLLAALRGQPPEDIVLLLGSIFDISKPAELTFLIRETGIEGFREIHAYYLKKLMETGDDSPFILYRWLLLCKNYAELIAKVREACEAGHAGDAQYIYFAALCGAPVEWIDQCADVLHSYSRILQAFYSGERLSAVSGEDARILNETYITVAFIAGSAAAERYLNVFKADPRLCYMMKARYCDLSGQLERVLSENMEGIPLLDFGCRKYRIQALLNVGRCQEALWEMEGFLDHEMIEQELLHMLLVAAEKCTGDEGRRTRELYDKYSRIYDATVDLTDVVNTGIVFDDSGTKLKKLYKSMTPEDFDSLKAEEETRPVTRALLDLSRKAAEVYKEKKAYAEVFRCLLRLIAHEQADLEDYECLADVFDTFQNTALADYIRGQAM